ncbi:MAG: HD domain-containing protein [bacterium]|nr:HD domain-containing protein [bacterium]
MKILDRVYGEFDISEPVLLDIINSRSLQRLKDIDQAGYPKPHFSGWHSRYEHSVGVCLLLRKYGASIEEQIAGLIHDVSHSAFSHCIDYVLIEGTEGDQSHQDNVFDEYVRNSDLPSILEKYGINTDYILNDAHFPLKEQSLPDLCADRIDYSLREAIIFGEIKDANYFLESLTAVDGKWIFRNFEAAKRYAELFLRLSDVYYAGLPTAIMFRTVGDYLRHSLTKKYISRDDLYTTDRVLLAKIAPHRSHDEHLALLYDRMNMKIPIRNDPHDYDAEVLCKSRAVDPLCYENGIVVRVSDLEPQWRTFVAEKNKPKRYFLKFGR